MPGNSALGATTAWINRSAGRVQQSEWRNAVQELVVTSVGQVRRGDRLIAALSQLEGLESEFDEVQIEGESPRQQFDCARRCLETRNLIQVARMLGTAALMREESRGGHFRLDFPAMDDANFRRNIVVWNEQGRVRAELRPVPDDSVAAEPPPGIASTAAMIAENV